VQQNWAYVGDGSNGIKILDITDPTNPEEVGNFDTGFYVQNITFDDNYIYIADGQNGVYIIEFQDPGVGISEQPRSVINHSHLAQNYPNPFNPSTQIKYNLQKSTRVSLKIYNIQGQEIRTLVNEFQSAGRKSVQWNGLDSSGHEVSSGVYIYKIDCGDFSLSKKMILIR